MKPIIGITIPNKIFSGAYLLIKLAVIINGGRPLPLKKIDSVNTVKVNGLILGGGTDIFPELFHNIAKKNYVYDHNRDEMEIAWLKKAEKEHIPVLAICRGAQMMNVMHEGTLHLDVSTAYENANYPQNFIRKIFFRKHIDIKPDSLLAKLFKTDNIRVNSMHKQSIDKIGKGLKVTATEKNGVVQAIEKPNHPFYLGVQFHPEFMLHRPPMRAIFKGLIKQSSIGIFRQ